MQKEGFYLKKVILNDKKLLKSAAKFVIEKESSVDSIQAIMHQKLHKITLFLLLSMSVMSAFAEEKTISATTGQLTGSFAVVNKYIYRGGVENDDVALQAGIEYAHNNGVAVGYWDQHWIMIHLITVKRRIMVLNITFIWPMLKRSTKIGTIKFRRLLIIIKMAVQFMLTMVMLVKRQHSMYWVNWLIKI
jgi:hypothetical protein